MAVGDVIELRLFSKFDEQVAINVRHYRVEAVTGTEQTYAAIAAAFATRFGGPMQELMSLHAAYEGLSVQKILPLPVMAPVFSTAEAGQGTVDDDPLPRQVSGVITLRTALAGPANRGRFYAPFPAENDNAVDTTPSPGYMVKLNTLGALLDDDLLVGVLGDVTTLQPVILHREGGTTTDITGYVARDRWGTQRRRGSYGPPNKLPF